MIDKLKNQKISHVFWEVRIILGFGYILVKECPTNYN